MRVQPRSSASSLIIGPSLRKRGSTIQNIFFHKTIANKGWSTLCQPPRPAATMVVREFYSNLAANVLEKVRVDGVFVDLSAKSINKYYNLDPVNSEAYDRLQETTNYPKVHKMLTNGRGNGNLTLKSTHYTSRLNT